MLHLRLLRGSWWAVVVGGLVLAPCRYPVVLSRFSAVAGWLCALWLFLQVPLLAPIPNGRVAWIPI